MNQHLFVEKPSEAGWTFSLDPTQAPTSYAAERRFTSDAQGRPFVDNTAYTLFAYHTDTRTLLSYLLIYRTGPEGCLLVPNSDIPDLQQVTGRGAITSLVVTVGGIRVRTLETVTSVDYLVGIKTAADGLKDFVQIAVASLPAGNGTGGVATPDFQIMAHYEPVPVSAADFEIIAHYEPAPIGTPLAVPGKPVDLSATRSGSSSGTDGILTWKLADTLETGVEVRTKNADGSWGSPSALGARTQSLNLPSIGWGITRTYQVRAVNGAGQGPWSDEASIRINSFIWEFALFGQGQPPVRIGALQDGQTQQLPTGNTNIGLQIWDRSQGEPTTEDYDRLTLYVILADGTRHGWQEPDIYSGPGPVPRYIFGRPDGFDLKQGPITVVGEIRLGTTLVETRRVTVDLIAPLTKPLAPTALRVARLNGVVQINWSENATNENYQRLEVQTGSGAWQKLVDLLPNVNHYETTTLNAEGATYSLRVLAGNTAGESDYSNTAVLTPQPPANRPPVIPALLRQTATVGQPFSYVLPAIGDPDGDQVTVGATGVGSGISFNGQARTFVGPATVTGTLTITVTATDSLGASSVATLLIDLIPQPNRLPVAPVLGDRSFVSGVAVSFVLPPFTDPDGDPMTYSVASLPSGLTFDPATRTVSGAPIGSGYSRTITYAASDNRGGTGTASSTWSITAAQPKAPIAPTLNPITLAADVPYFETILPPFADPQGQALTYAMTDLPAGLSFEGATRKLSGYAETSGQVRATYSATNTAGLTGSTTQVLNITIPTITQVRGRLRSLGGSDWVLEAEIIVSQRGVIRYHVDRLRNRSSAYAEADGLLNNTTLVLPLYSSRSTNPGTGTFAQPPNGSGTYYLHLQVARNPASYAVYGFWLENYYDWTLASAAEPLPPLPQS